MNLENRRLKYNLSGARFGKWTVVSHVSHGVWECVCDCGNIGSVNGKNLRNGFSKSCGCRRVIIGDASRTHGHTANRSPTPEYISYSNMLKRCLNPKNHKFPAYGGRGIKVCDQWRASFQNFYADMGAKPSASHSLDRIDVNGNYEPSNCRWADVKTQSLNKRGTVTVEHEGKTVPLMSLCESLGLNYGTVHSRIFEYGMTLEEAISKKPKLSETQVREILAAKPFRGVTVELAKKYGVSDALISQIRRGIAWARYFEGGAA